MSEKDDLSAEIAASMPLNEVKRRAATALARPEKTELSPMDAPLEEGLIQSVLFKGHQIRQVFHEKEWFFSIVDVVAAVTESEHPARYWSDVKRQLAEKEGFDELYGKIVQLKMPGKDGKMYATEAVNVETLFRVVQSIPSNKAEPFKRWLARVGYERIQEFHDPEIAVKRAILNWQIQGRTNDWIEARLRSIVVRNELTSEWAKRGVKQGIEYAYLTNVISKETFGLKTENHKSLKGLTSQNLRDHMTDLELVFTMLGEKSTAAITQATDAQGLSANETAAKSGGKVAGDARKELEKKLGRPVVSGANFLKASRKNDPEKLTDKSSR